MGDVIEFEPRFSLTDRQRELLRIHAWVCADMAYDDIDERGDDPVDPAQWWYLFDRLPDCTYSQPAAWRRQIARSFDDLAADLGSGQLPPPRTLAPPPAGLPASSPTGVQHAGEEDLAPGALIFARSEGYCELMVADCRVMARAIASRVPNHGGGDASTSTQFAVCEECAITLRRTDHLLVQRLGYRVEHAPSAVSTPFLWRQQQRVLRDAGGGLHSTARRSTTSPSCRDRIGGRTARAVRGGARASPPQCARNVAERAASKIA